MADRVGSTGDAGRTHETRGSTADSAGDPAAPGRSTADGLAPGRSTTDDVGPGRSGSPQRAADGSAGTPSGTARPATLGTWVASALAMGGVLGVGVGVGNLRAVSLGAGGAVVLAVAVTLLNREGPAWVAAGTSLAAPAMLVLVLAPLTGPAPVVVACSLAAFGAAAGPLRSLGGGKLVEALGMATYGMVPLGVTAIVVALWPAAGTLANLVAEVVLPARAGPDLLGFALVVVGALLALRAAVRALPAAELAGRNRRAAVQSRLDAAGATLTRWTRYATVGVLAGMVLWVLVLLSPGSLPPAVADLLRRTVRQSALRLPAVGLLVAGAVVVVTVRAVRWTGTTLLDRARRGAAAATGLVITLVLAGIHRRLYREAARAAPGRGARILGDFALVLGELPTVLLVASVVLLSFVLAALLIPAVVGLGLAPERSLAPALAAGGLLAGGALGADAAPPVVVFGAVAAAMVVWDVGEHAVGLGEEVGTATAPGPQAVHAAASVLAGTVAVGGAAGLYAVVTARRAGGPLTVAGLVAAFLGVLLLLAALRG